MKVTKILKIGIVGHGFVGKATDWGFNRKVEKFIVDPIYNTKIDNLISFNPDVIFVCVPTPMGENGKQNSKIIKAVIKELSKKCTNSIIVIKSTVLPSVLEDLEKINSKIIYNPEFLREKHANYDFRNTQMIIFGGDRNTASIVSKFYKLHSRCLTKEHIFLDLLSASLVKYALNTFLATKVVFFNELFNLFEKLDTKDSWKNITDAISLDSRIGQSHMQVPGHDGKKGFGGACFPKDSYALVKYAEKVNVDMKTLKTVIDSNNKIRSSYSSLDVREFEQNVSFDDKI